ncbi:hypothetical protein O181_066808 [Austropuccinia psidii MF-1]|uniref:Uncharacterized protein n=1 Tax=Austropuccinia psidii MF-1 TaxID=1389203 RepID=A0A9Q3I3Y0_9BASI|nr:hypothetical protein [Austropuccinia psidii MF-1]
MIYGPPEPILAPNLNLPKNEQKELRTQIGHFQTVASGNQLKSSKPPLQSGDRLSLTNVLRTKNSGMVHIWYNIPLSTNFAQQYNGDVFGTKLCHSNSVPQIHHPF